MRTIPLTKGKTALVDNRYYGPLTAMGSWCYQSPGYAATRTDNALLLMHRVVADWEWRPDTRFLDHRNRNRLDNRVANLRYARPTDNLMNSSPRRDNTSGYRGVFWHKRAKKWMAQIKYEGITHYLGLFDSKVDAAIAYNTKVVELAGEFARLNKVES